MTWLIYGLQEESDRVSHRVSAGGSLGAAIFRVRAHPSPSGDDPIPLRVVERDQGLVDRHRIRGRTARRRRRRREQDTDDALGVIHAHVQGARARALRFEEEAQDLRGGGATLSVVLLLSGDRAPPLGSEAQWLEGLPANRKWEIPVPEAAIEDDQDPYLEVGVLGPDQTWDDHAPLRIRKHPGPRVAFAPEPEDTNPDTEWDRLSPLTPEENETTTLHGRPIVFGRDGIPRVDIGSGRLIAIVRYREAGRALQYNGENAYNCRNVAKRTLIEQYTGTDRYRELLVAGFHLLGEGNVSAINTYDNQIVTLGAGFAGGRLNGVMSFLEGETRDTLAEVLDELPGFVGLQTDLPGHYPRAERWNDEARALRHAIPVYARFIQVVEHRRHCLPWALANVLEWVEGSGVGTGGDDVAAVNAKLAELGEAPQQRALINMTAYLRHGRSALTPNPPADVLFALENGSTPSEQLAIVFKLHAEACWSHANASDAWRARQTRIILERGFGKKMGHFETGYNEDRGPTEDEPWKLDFGQIRAVLPCLGERPHSWRTPRGEGLWNPLGDGEAAPEGHVVLPAWGKRYDFGPPLRSSAPEESE